ncbi:MAG TPA: DCC1-like thiol-disulfide oxidoreductase family protein [Candidatus Obscuribacterales bacterium]
MNIQQPRLQLSKNWNAYWFLPSPLFDLALCRIIIIGFQLGYIILKSYHAKILKQGDIPGLVYDPLPIVGWLTFPWGVEQVPPDWFLSVIFYLTFIFGITALIGFKTNLSLIIFAIGNLFIQSYIFSFGSHHHPQALLLITLFILALSPSGAVLSLDDLLRKLQTNIKKQRFLPFNLLNKKSEFARWPLLTVQWLFALIYLSAALHKLTQGGGVLSTDWMNGYTLQYFLTNDGLRWGSDLGVWLGQYRIVGIVFAWMSIIFEATFFLVLIFPRLVWVYIPAGLGFHTGIYLAQRAPFFPFMALYSVFMPWTWMIKTFSRLQLHSLGQNKPEILYDGLCPLCIRSMTVLCYFDWFQRLIYTPVEEQWASIQKTYPDLSLDACLAEMHLILPDGSVRKGFFAFREIIRYLPPLWPLLAILYFPGSDILGPKIYGFVASRRKRLTRCSFDSCSLK